MGPRLMLMLMLIPDPLLLSFGSADLLARWTTPTILRDGVWAHLADIEMPRVPLGAKRFQSLCLVRL